MPWTIGADGLRLQVRLTPRGGRDGLDGIETLADGRRVLKLRVSAPPEAGAANAALIRLVAACCGVARSRVALVSGASARVKTLTVAGDGGALLASLRRGLPDAPD